MTLNKFEIAITINLPDTVIANTVLKRKATCETMIYNLKSRSLATSWRIDYFANNGGNYGDIIDVPGISSFTRELIADNTSIFDTSTGKVVKQSELDADPAKYNASTTLWGEFDFYQYVGANQPSIIHNLIIQAGQQAAADNRF
jgi:hypothetical protein